jgi:hypothetical protein
MHRVPDRTPSVVSAAIIASRLFDVADTIDLEKAETLWTRQLRSTATRGQLASTAPKAIAFGVPPLEIAMLPLRLRLDQAETEVAASVRLFDFGVVRLALRFSADNLTWADFVERLISVDRIVGPAAGSDVWSRLLREVQSIFGDAFLHPSQLGLEEDYLIGIVSSFDEVLPADELQQRIDLVPLLSGEQRPLSEGARRDLLRERFSYYTDDLVVVTWDRAFIYDPRNDSDVMDVLDVANAQLLEMRYYDHLLDNELPRMYDEVQTMQRIRPLLSSRRFANLARRLYTLVAEVTELREKVDNALQVTEDVYLARIYAAALDLFRVPAVSTSVDRKLAIIRDTYSALYEEASAGRAVLIELAIVALIAIEIVLALLRS